jgi:hypothetical protein
MAGEKFYLIFSEEPNHRVRINEVINYSEVDFNLDQREGKMGRDVSLSGGKLNFKFTIYRHGKEFEKILYYAHRYGFEADVKLIIVLSDGTEFKGELDFLSAESNDFNYFDCPVIVESETQIFRRRSETKVDLFSNVDINGEAITPLVPVNMLLKAKPSLQISEWKYIAESSANAQAVAPILTSLTQSIVSSEIKNTYVPYQYFAKLEDSDDMKILTTDSLLKNISVDIKGLDISIFNQSDKISRIYIRYGTTYETATQNILYTQESSSEMTISGDLPTFYIDQLQRGQSVWLYLRTESQATFTVTTKGSNVIIKASSTAYNTITPCIHVIDALKQISKSISGLDVFAPRYQSGGDLYGTVITNGNLLRNVFDKPFYVSWDDIFDKSISPEVNADSEIQIDKRVFVGIEKDFYTSDECGFFNDTQFSTMSRKPNLFYALNNFNYKYENYQSLKENTEPNSDSTIHGQSIFTPYNQKTESSRELSIKWIRDAILLDVQQRLSTAVSKDTATQDDDKIFAIDTIETVNDQQFTESTTLQHSYDGTYLFLRSNGEVNFNVLGIRTGTVFNINYPDANNGNYNVITVSNTELKLQRTSGGSISPSNDGIRLTKYTYEIKKETIPLTNRTNEGFTSVLNLISPDKYSNLRYSVERNIRNFYNNYLATVNLYWKDKVLKNTFYKNNGDCETEYNGLRVKEKEDWIPTDPIVTPYMYENVIFANVDFSKFISLQNQIRTRRGFIRAIDNNKRVLKLYPIKMSYENKTRQLTISGQEKFESVYMTIVKQNGIITVNNETKLRKLKYKIEDDYYIVLYDLENYKLYNRVVWDKISVNGAIPETIEILKNWLDLLV